MPATSALALALAAAALVCGSAWYILRASRSRHAARARYFEALKPLFESGETRIQPTGFPRMTGRRGALSFDLQAIPDSLTFRKLPALWVMVSLPAPMPVRAELDLMARPSGQEPFSRFGSLPHSLPAPAFLPQTVALRSDNAAGVPPEALVERHADLFSDDRVKELLISPKGLRIVILAEEADRGRYLIFRDAEMGMAPLSPDRIAPLLDRLTALRDDLLLWAKGMS
jgi:hypothetical protein